MENDNGVVVLSAVLILSAFLLIVLKFVHSFNDFNHEKQYLLGEMHRADNKEEYRYWRRQLCFLYLCLIPFVSERTVTKLYRIFFRRAKHAQKRSDDVLQIIAPSMIGIVVCAVCLCGVSWAWFTAFASTGTTTIEAPEKYELADLTVNGSSIYSNSKREYIISGGTYNMELSAIGTPGATGYCMIESGADTKYTDQITLDANGEARFKFTVKSGSEITLTLKWGSFALRNSSNTITNGDEITINGTYISNSKSDNNAVSLPNESVVSEATLIKSDIK